MSLVKSNKDFTYVKWKTCFPKLSHHLDTV